MLYDTARPAQLKRPVQAKVVGKQEFVDYKAGRKCTVQRDPHDPGQFIIYFVYNRAQGRAIISRVSAADLNETVTFLDSQGNL